MSESMWILYFLREHKEFFNQESILSFLTALAGQHFRLIADSEDSEIYQK